MRKYYAHQTMRFDHFAAKTEFTQFRVKKKKCYTITVQKYFAKMLKTLNILFIPSYLQQENKNNLPNLAIGCADHNLRITGFEIR